MSRIGWLVVWSLAAGPLAAQGTLAQAAETARAAWLAHDAQSLVGQSASVVLQIPGADPSWPLGRAQAVELLRRHLRTASERSVAVTSVREVEPGKGFVELDRRYVVPGTADERHEAVFLGFRLAGNRWLLSEVRATP
jgi:hypothetical protein